MTNPSRKSLEFALGGRVYVLEFVATGDLPTVDHEHISDVLDIAEDGGPGTFRITDVSMIDAMACDGPQTLQASTLSRS